MADTEAELTRLFSPSGTPLSPEILDLLQSILRICSLTPQELFYKWESYCLKMGPDDISLDIATARMFSKDVQDSMERAAQQVRQTNRISTINSTPRTNGASADVYGMLDGLTPSVGSKRNGSVKRKNDFSTPAPKRTAVANTNGTPSGISFTQRQNPGQVLESLNVDIPAAEPPLAPWSESRIKLIANTDVKKFNYKPMSMRLTEASATLDERIDDYITLVQKQHKLEDSAFGNAAAQSASEIVVVGRIASDTPEGKLNPASIVLEMSRRMGAGLRVPLKLDDLTRYTFFPGQIVALRGTNASGLYFQPSEILAVDPQPLPTTTPSEIQAINTRLEVTEDSNGTPLSVLFAAGPYTPDDNLDFAPFTALCDKAIEASVDALILTGPFLDIEHPSLSTGDFDMPDIKTDTEPNMNTLFRLWISSQLDRVCSAIPSITVIMVPSVRDVISKHVAWPQEGLPPALKRELGLPKQVRFLPDPCFISLNEVILGITSHDILHELSKEQISKGQQDELFERLPRILIDQRHFFPLYPSLSRDKLSVGGVRAVGDAIDLGYYKLGEWPAVRPDVLLTPSILPPMAKVCLI